MIYRVGYKGLGEDTFFELNTVGKEVKLIYSELDTSWYNKGECALSLEDTDNGVKINKIGELDYSVVEELYILLKYYFENSPLNIDKIIIDKFERID